MEREHSIRKTFSPADAGQYLRLPFDVPADTERVEVGYAYGRFVTENLPDGRRRQEVATIDLGLYDETGRLRGWSGSERSSVWVSASSASPGYEPGPVREGRWAVSLGLYRVRAPVEVTIAIRLPERREVLLAGDLHVHTVNSDGALRTSELIELCRREGLDFVALTDHNSTRQNGETAGADGITVIPGMEYTNYRGHANLFFAGHDRGPWNAGPGEGGLAVDPLANSFEEMRDALEAAREAGATVSLNHPFNYLCPWKFGFEGFAWDLVEAWNGTGDPGDAETIAWWHGLLCRGARMPVVGGSDFHRHEVLRSVGAPTTFVNAASRSAADIVAGLRAGRSFVSFSKAGPLLDLRVKGVGLGGSAALGGPEEGTATMRSARAGDQVRLLDGKGNVMEWKIPWDGEHITRFSAAPDAIIYRMEVRRALAPGVVLLVALSNPVYIQPARP